jgi:cell division protein FtsB
MSDNRTRYRAIKPGLIQLHPRQVTGRQMQRLNVLAMFISSLIGSGKSQNRQVAKKVATKAKLKSRLKQLSRGYKNEELPYNVDYLP